MVSYVSPHGEEGGCYFRLNTSERRSLQRWPLSSMTCCPRNKIRRADETHQLTNEHSLPVGIILFQKQLFAYLSLPNSKYQHISVSFADMSMGLIKPNSTKENA